MKLEYLNGSDHGPCECCGAMSRLVAGIIHRDGREPAAYQIHWTLGQIERHGAEVYLILGRWGDGATREDRYGVAMHFFRTADSHGFTVVDAGSTPLAHHELVGRALPREEVIGTPLAGEVFALVDFICDHDGRIAEISLVDSCENCRAHTPGEKEEEQEPDFSDVPGFGAGPVDSPQPRPRLSERIAFVVLGLVLTGCGAVFAVRGSNDSSFTTQALGALMVIAGLAVAALHVRRCPKDDNK